MISIKRNILFITFLLAHISVCEAGFNQGGFSKNGFSTSEINVENRLKKIGGLTFYKDYRLTESSLNGDHAIGSPTAVYTAARSASAPATYVDGAGVVRLLTTANVRRRQGGYYDATGFHVQSGEMIEAAGTNLITKANNVEDAIFTKTNVTADNADTGSSSPDNTATAPSLTATGANGTFLLATAVTARTYSVWLKRKTGTGTIQITADSGVSYDTVTLDTAWRRFKVREASASQTCGIKIVTSGDALYVWGNQFEAFPYATSFIPTTTAALSRPGERLSYLISDNLVDVATIVIKFAPESVFENDSVNRRIFHTLAAIRTFNKPASTALLTLRPNNTDSNPVLAALSTVLQANTSYVAAGVSQHSSPYAEIYLDGVSEGTYTAGDYVANVFGQPSFYVGSDGNNLTDELGGIIQAIAIFSRVLSAAEVLAVYNILQSGGL